MKSETTRAWLRRLFTTQAGLISLGQLATVFLVGVAVHWIWSGLAPDASSSSDAGADPAETSVARKWTCSMHPSIQKDGPGACPICGMDLIPLTSSATFGMRFLPVTPEARALMDIQVTPVERRYVSNELRLVGKVEYDETRRKFITARVPGRLERLFVDYTGIEVRQGDHMAKMYSEELYAAQQELIQAARAARKPKSKKSFFGADGVDLLASAREKLRLLGLTRQQIADIEKQEKPSDDVMIFAPMGGIVVEKLKQQGDRVKTGERIYAIADLAKVWVMLDAYESDLDWIRYGQLVEISTEAYSGMKPLTGRIAKVDPFLTERTRTVKVRVNVDNREGLLKPGMFVRGVVRAKVAGRGAVIAPGLAGKWISPMHPEIVKPQPGKCDICGMPLVRAESLGYVLSTDSSGKPPLVIPVSAAMRTGTRAVVYVELPRFPRRILNAFDNVTNALLHSDLKSLRRQFASFAQLIAEPNPLVRSEHDLQLWNRQAARIHAEAKLGGTAPTKDAAELAYAATKQAIERMQEHFSPQDKPTFAGREVVLGPRAGQSYLVEHGLAEGELVVTRGNFKIDSALQIEAKPSMMTPAGGGGGGHDHGGQKPKADSGEHDGSHDPSMALPITLTRAIKRFLVDVQTLDALTTRNELEAARKKYSSMSARLRRLSDDDVDGHARLVWKELRMLLSNDLFEGSTVTSTRDAGRVLASFKNTLKRVDARFGVSGYQGPVQYDVSPQFQQQLAAVWNRYTAVSDALAADKPQQASAHATEMRSALDRVDMKLLTDDQAHQAWMRELAGLKKTLGELSSAKDIKSQRESFWLISQMMRPVALSFGFGTQQPVYQHRCTMAFNNKGAFWLQSDGQGKTRNPYFGASMFRCAQQVQLISGDNKASESPKGKSHQHPK